MQVTENYLLGHVSSAEQVLFSAKLLLDPVLRDDVYWQRKTYGLVRDYGRQRLREELEHLHRELFTAPQHRSFRERIRTFFPK